MKLNYDCIRDVLLFIEEHIEINYENGSIGTEQFNWSMICDNTVMLTKYQKNDLYYTVIKLYEAGSIVGKDKRTTDGKYAIIFIRDISWDGHEFLNSIRQETVWNRVKETCKKSGTLTIKGLTTVASAVIQGIAQNSELISKTIDLIK